jgi:hypothetical protein
MDERLRTTAASLLEPGETIEATGRARPGRVSVKANVALAAATLVLSGGNATMHASKKDVSWCSRMDVCSSSKRTGSPSARSQRSSVR